MTFEGNQLTEIIKAEYDALDKAGVEAISPKLIEQMVYARIDPETVSPVMVQYAARMYLRELARRACGKTHLKLVSGDQQCLWPQLQSRYPALRDGDDCYVLRAKLTYEERMENIARLRAEARTKHDHADALKSETEDLVRLGLLAFSNAPVETE